MDFENQPALTQQSILQAQYQPVTSSCGSQSAGPAIVSGPVAVSGGVVVSLSGTQNNVYWTMQAGAGGSACPPVPNMQRVVAIQFALPVSNVSLLLGTAAAGGTFTVADDQGDAATVSLAPSSAQTVSLPAANIRKVSVTPAVSAGWSYYLDNITYSPVTPSIALLDPVPELQDNNSIVTDPGLLSIAGTPVAGVSADSAARLVLRIDADAVGEQLTLTLIDDQGAVSSSAADDGELATIDGRKMGGQVQLTAVHTIAGPMAFALYFPPANFVRQNGLAGLLSALPLPESGMAAADSGAVTRSVTLKLVSSTVKGASATLPIVLARPPVLLVHDLWGGPQDWNSFAAVVNDSAQRFFVARANYDESLDGRVLASSPAYTGFGGRSSALGLAFNAPLVWEQLGKQLLQYRREKSLAAAQADVVAHGMGGLVARTLENLSGAAGADSFGAGEIHKLIAIGTENFGTPAALQLIDPGDTNACTRNWLAAAGEVSYLTAAIDTASNVVTGGIADVRGDGRGDDLAQYPPLNALRIPNGHPAATAFLAALTLPANLGSLACPGNSAACLLRQVCGGNLLAQDLSPSGWFSIFNQANDGFVPLTSQLNSLLPLGYMFPGIVHSAGLQLLGFTGPTELNETVLIQPTVVQLLNAAVNAAGFLQLP